MSFLALIQKQIFNLELQDLTYQEEMFDFKIYDKRLQKSNDLERIFREELLDEMFKNGYPLIEF